MNTDISDEKNRRYRDYIARVSSEKIPCYEPILGSKELENLKEVIESNWLSEGKFTRLFEHRLAKLSERNFSLSFTNATSALISGMKALGIGSGDEVIVPSFAHSADPNSICQTGATPIFADVEEQSMCITPSTIENLVTESTKAILYVCAYGNVGDLNQIAVFSKDRNIHFINDCAPAIFGHFRGKSIPSFGVFSVLSFFADKTITTGEGGMLLTDSKNIIEECNIMKHDGRRERGHDLIERIGYNFRITELQTAVGVAQLDRASGFISRKNAIYDQYTALLKETKGVHLFEFNKEAEVNIHRVIIMVENAKDLIGHLTSQGIGARRLFMPMHSQPIYRSEIELPITEKLYSHGVCLPSGPSLSSDDIECVCEAISSFYR